MGVGGEVAPDTNKIFMEETNMKKIIATVLAMVMALALCTTAFAATTTTLTAKDYKFLNSTTNEDREGTRADTDTLVFYAEEKSVSTVDGKTTTTITPAYYLFNNNKYVVVDDSCANTKIVKDGKIVAMALVVSSSTAVSTSDVVTATIKGVKDAECGQYEGENDTFYVIDGKTYKANANGGKYALLNGKVVVCDAAAANAEAHTLDVNKVTSDKGTVTAVYCTKCKNYVPVVKSIPATSVETYKTISVGNTPYYYLDKPVSGTPANGTGTTTSPKTFDAGIAMYVGMALTSVAGSAVVIGKKKEF